jgi:hypothetical protein
VLEYWNIGFITGISPNFYKKIYKTAAGCWLLVAGRWLLVAGHWLLAPGRWLLVTGRWSLISAFRIPTSAFRVLSSVINQTDNPLEFILILPVILSMLRLKIESQTQTLK